MFVNTFILYVNIYRCLKLIQFGKNLFIVNLLNLSKYCKTKMMKKNFNSKKKNVSEKIFFQNDVLNLTYTKWRVRCLIQLLTNVLQTFCDWNRISQIVFFRRFVFWCHRNTDCTSCLDHIISCLTFHTCSYMTNKQRFYCKGKRFKVMTTINYYYWNEHFRIRTFSGKFKENNIKGFLVSNQNINFPLFFWFRISCLENILVSKCYVCFQS